VVSIDGHDIRTLQLRWLRSQLGLVSQVTTPPPRLTPSRTSSYQRLQHLGSIRGMGAGGGHPLGCL
jgi:ABC-type cobalamin/Fe3+-siderophores transport system ATPase subunit